MNKHLLLFSGNQNDLSNLRLSPHSYFKNWRILQLDSDLMAVSSTSNGALFRKRIVAASKKFPKMSFDLFSSLDNFTRFQKGKALSMPLLEESLINKVCGRVSING